MANNRNCGCGRRRGCLNSVRCARWDNYPYYGGSCPDADGEYCETEAVRGADAGDDCRCRHRRRRRDGDCFGLFTASVPMAVAANGVIPLISGYGCGQDFCVNCGQITLEDAGVYLATYTARAPETMESDTTITLNVNEVSQPSAVATLAPGGSVTAQAIFNASENSVVSLRTSAPVSASEPSLQPAFTLSLIPVD